MSILVIGASSSKNSINKALATYAASLTTKECQVIDLNDFEMPIFSVDREEANGIPELAKKFKALIKNSDGIIISFAEHNGAYSTAFKNIIDWVSRFKSKLWEDKNCVFLATSPGARGGKSVLGIALDRFPHMGATILGSLSVPSFYDNFKDGKLINEELNSQLKELVSKL